MADEPEIMEVEEAETLLDLDALNDLDMSTVEDAPEFINDPPTGTYTLGISAKIEKKADKTGKPMTRIRHIYHVQEVHELLDKQALVPPEGSMFSETFQCTAEGLKYWKQRAKGILGDLGDAKLKAVIDSLNDGVSFKSKVGTKQTPKDGGGHYVNVQIRPISQDQNPPFTA